MLSFCFTCASPESLASDLSTATLSQYRILLPIELHIVRTARRTLRRPTTDRSHLLVDQSGKSILAVDPFGHAGHRRPLDIFPITRRFGEDIGLDDRAIEVGGFDLGNNDVPSNVSDVLVL